VADRIGNLYFVREGKPTASITCEKTYQNFVLWHQRLGYVNKRCLLEMITKGRVKGINFEYGDVNLPCEIYIKGKQIKLPFRDVHCRSKGRLEIVHTDLCGPMRTTSMGGAKYFVTFIDDCTRWTEVFFLR